MQKKKAGIYDRWLSSLGGGEQVAFAYAQAFLKLGYSVELITHKEVSKEKAEKKMGVNLRNIPIRYIPNANSHELSGITEEYDVFVNTSHLDYFANRSKLGILSVFFPGIIKLSPFEYLKRAFFIPSFRAFFVYPSRYEGFQYDTHEKGKIYKILSEKSSIVFNDSISNIKITLFFPTLTFAVLDDITFSYGNKALGYLKRSVDHQDNIVTYAFTLPEQENKKFTIHLSDHQHAQGAALIKLTLPSIRYVLYNLFKKFFPVWEMRLHGGPGVTKKSDINSYNTIITISEFCRGWIQKYWGVDSAVLYPPVNTSNFSPSKEKENIILHVGRFFQSGHSKKQIELVKVFKKMCNRGETKGWQLHLVGSVEEGLVHQQYFDKVVKEAKGYPIQFHTKLDFPELQKLFSKAKIYWHATGLDENPDSPIAFEHFGITTVEAMASGCVPIVINAGGQPEIVIEGTGFTWNTRKELTEQTKKIIQDDDLRESMSTHAIERSHYFSRDNFVKRFKEMLQTHG